MDKLYIVMPTYNEEANIRDVVKSWYPVLEGKDGESRLVIADGGSKDKTLEILHELEKEYPQLVVISMPGTDHGTKVWALYDYAISGTSGTSLTLFSATALTERTGATGSSWRMC